MKRGRKREDPLYYDATSEELLHFHNSHVRVPLSRPFAEHIYISGTFFFSEHTYLELDIQKLLVKVLLQFYFPRGENTKSFIE